MPFVFFCSIPPPFERVFFCYFLAPLCVAVCPLTLRHCPRLCVGAARSRQSLSCGLSYRGSLAAAEMQSTASFDVKTCNDVCLSTRVLHVLAFLVVLTVWL